MLPGLSPAALVPPSTEVVLEECGVKYLITSKYVGSTWEVERKELYDLVRDHSTSDERLYRRLAVGHKRGHMAAFSVSESLSHVTSPSPCAKLDREGILSAETPFIHYTYPYQ